MTIPMSRILDRFAERTPIPVMMRAILERCLGAESLDRWFDQTADAQYQHELMFSSVFEMMTEVVFSEKPSVHTAYRARCRDLGVSARAVYDKLGNLEVATSAALVRYAFEQAEELSKEMGGQRQTLLAGWRLKVLDGNCLGAREHRLEQTRDSRAAVLPGKSLAVFDPQYELFSDLFPCEDAYTQERALLPAVLETVRAGELWLGDRNFCTRQFIETVSDRGGAVLVREHEQLRFTPLEPMRKCGDTKRGRVREQRVRLGDASETEARVVRRICVDLNEPTRDGDHQIYLLSTVPEDDASAVKLAKLYLKRWRIETAFQKLTEELSCEINTLGYPKAALFGFAVAVVGFNVLSVLKAALGAVHGRENIEQNVSSYYLVDEISSTNEALIRVVDAEDWNIFRELSLASMAAWLLACAERVSLDRYLKSPRGPKKAAPKPQYDPKRPHISVARLLAERDEQRRAQRG